MDQNKTLPSIMKVMEEKQKRYKEKLKIWGFEKNLTRRQSKFITRKALRRLDEEGKKTEFRIKGNVVPQDKVDHHLKKPNGGLSSTGSSPSGLSYQTFRPDIQSPVSRGRSTPQSQQLILSPPHPHPLSPARLQRQRSHNLNPTNALALDWHGLDLDALRDLHTRAVDTAEGGNHGDARMMFCEAMDGLESLVGSTHHSTIEVLSSFVKFCLSHSFYDEAKDRMQKSLADHQAEFGDLHKRTLMSMVRLGHFYMMREQYGNSEIILFRAKIGFERLFQDDAEELFINTLDIGKNLSELHMQQGDLDRSEQEHLSMMSKAEVLQGPYESQVLRLKHDLAHLYIDNGDKLHRFESGTVPPFLKVEKLLLECIEASETTSTGSGFSLCSFELLRNQYHRLDEDFKLENLLVRIESKTQAVSKARDTSDGEARRKLCELKSGLARSYSKLGNRVLAEWWYLRLQPELETCYGVDSRQAFQNLMQTGIFYLGQGEWDEAEPYFRDAQLRADVVLEPDDPVKEKIAQCLRTREHISGCGCCML